MWSEIRRVFLESATAALQLAEDPAVTERWDEPSALTGYSVGGLSAHLCRAVSTALGYLDDETTALPHVDAAGYFLGALGDHDPADSQLHLSVRQRSDDMAASGPIAVVDATRAALQSLTVRLEVEPADRVLVVFGGMSILLDDYLETRIVELVIHADDLAASCSGVGEPSIPEEGWAIAKRVVSEVAAQRVGDREFVLGLSRAERSQRPLAF